VIPKPDTIKSVLMLAGIGGALYLAYKAKKGTDQFVKQAEVAVTKTLNPASSENVVYTNTPNFIKSGFNSVFAGLDSVGLLPK